MAHAARLMGVVAGVLLVPAWALAQEDSASGGNGENPAGDSAAEQIKRLIPFATAMPHRTFEAVGRMGQMPKFEQLGDESVTALLMFYPPEDRKAAEKHFRFLGTTPKPSQLAREMRRTVGTLRIPLMPCTMIHADRITRFTCEVEGDTATGTVAFRVPDLYEGEIQYVARRNDNVWRIERFLLPGYGRDVVRTADGGWKAEERAGNTQTPRR